MKPLIEKQKINRLAVGCKKTMRRIAVLLLTLIAGTRTVFAEEIKDSKIAKGFEKLLNDATNWLLIIAPSVAVLCIVYFLIRKAASDEMDHRKWNTRITIAIVSALGAVLASVIIKLIIGYFE